MMQASIEKYSALVSPTETALRLTGVRLFVCPARSVTEQAAAVAAVATVAAAGTGVWSVVVVVVAAGTGAQSAVCPARSVTEQAAVAVVATVAAAASVTNAGSLVSLLSLAGMLPDHLVVAFGLYALRVHVRSRM